MVKRNWYFLFIVLLFMVITACSNNEEANGDQQEPANETPPGEKQTEEVTKEPEEPAYNYTYPFTGEKTNDSVDGRAVAVMINNHPKARPQTGLSKADIVFEILSEYNITRFLAVFQSEKPEMVGPVRSARPYYFNLAYDYDALYVHHGAANFINELKVQKGVNFLDGAVYDNDGHLFKREDFRVAPHNSYLLYDAVYEVAESKGYAVKAEHKALPFLDEEATQSIDGQEATEVSFAYTSIPVRYTYDSETEKYSRFNGEMQSVELNTEEPIQLDNVFILETYHQVVDDAGRREIDLQSGGDGYLLQKGKVQQVEWRNVDGQILPYKDGEPVGFVPGKTWINVIPSSDGLASVTVQ